MNLTNPENKEFDHAAVAQYECPRAMEFSIGAQETKSTLEFTCGWDGDWTGAVSPKALPQCICELVFFYLMLVPSWLASLAALGDDEC